jgi:hypothetical protein
LQLLLLFAAAVNPTYGNAVAVRFVNLPASHRLHTVRLASAKAPTGQEEQKVAPANAAILPGAQSKQELVVFADIGSAEREGNTVPLSAEKRPPAQLRQAVRAGSEYVPAAHEKQVVIAGPAATRPAEQLPQL